VVCRLPMDPLRSILPFDILTEVIDHLDPTSDTTTLKALSTACVALLEPSQRKLFSERAIMMIPSRSILDIPLKKSPHLATYVRQLTLTFTIPHTDSSTVVSIIHKMDSIKCLRLWHSGDANLGRFPEWREWVTVIIHRPSLQHLTLRGHGTLPSTVWPLPALKSIDMGTWGIEDVLPPTILPHQFIARMSMVLTGTMPVITLGRLLQLSPHLHELKLHVERTLSSFPKY